MTRNPALSDHAARAASCKTRWYWFDGFAGARKRHGTCCQCVLCEACRKAYVAGWAACVEAAAKKRRGPSC